MITCIFESGARSSLRHVVTHSIVSTKDKILLVERGNSTTEAHKWALPGGYLDRDETAEQGVLRELQEETGWVGRVIGLFRINTNPHRPKEDRQNIVLEYLIEPMRQTGKPDREISDVRWFAYNDLPRGSAMAFDHEQSLHLYLEHAKKGLSLPIIS